MVQYGTGTLWYGTIELPLPYYYVVTIVKYSKRSGASKTVIHVILNTYNLEKQLLKHLLLLYISTMLLTPFWVQTALYRLVFLVPR